MTEPTPTVYVVDDDEAVRHSLRWLLESVGLPVETYGSAGAFLDSYDAARPGCLVLDVRLPDISGLQLQETLAARRQRLPVIIVTAHAEVPMAVRAMKAGAVDFIQKPYSDQQLLERIHTCLAQDAGRWHEEREQMALRERLDRLTARERQVLDAVLAGKPNKVIAADLGISAKTVEVHRAHVMRKMEAGSLAQLVHLCVRVQGV